MSGPAYRFGVLGPLLVERDGVPLAVASGHQRALLSVLLAVGQPVSRDRLIDELWGDRPPASAAKAVHVFVSRLRAQIGDVVVHGSGGYVLSAGAHELDAARFSSLVAQARAEPARGQELLAEALGLIRGEPLADVHSEGVVAQWRRALAREHLEAIVAKIDFDLAAGGGQELVVALERLVDEHPYEERIWGQLMTALHRCGRQADALDAYQRVRRLFAYELGMEPGEPLARLQRLILEGASPLVTGAAVAASAGTMPAPVVIPRPLGTLVGRTSELSELAGLLADPDTRALTLVGVGGVGKTRLALELARLQEAGFADGAVFVALEQLDDPKRVAAEIAAALGRRTGRPPPTPDRLAEALAGREWLIVLDSFEHLIPAASSIAALLAAAQGVRMIVTSRAPLRIRGERLFAVEPLALPVGDEADALADSPAVRLFLALAAAVNQRLESNAELMPRVAAICRELEGLPLGIELAAAQLRVLTLEELDASLGEPLRLGRWRPRDLPERHRTLEATIRWSYNLLTPGVREVLLAASVFRGGFTVEALEAVVGRDVQTGLDALRDASLVRREADERRFGMLELVRSFALTELAATGRLGLMRARHRSYFAGLAASVGAALDDGDPAESIATRLRPEHGNLRAALDDAIEGEDRPHALMLVRGMRSLWYAGWLRDEGHELIDRVFQRFDVAPNDELVLLRAGSFLDGIAADSVTYASFTHLLARRAEDLEDLPTLSTAVANLAALALNAQDRDEVARLTPRLLTLADADIPPRHRAFVNYSLALAEYIEGDLETAVERASQAVAQAASADHAYALGTAVGLRVMLSAARDGLIRRSDLANALAIIRRAAVKPLAVVALWLVARYAAAVDRDAALRWLVSAEQIFAGLDTRLWPESDLRADTLAALGLKTAPAAADRNEPDCMAELAAADEWLAGRPADEVAACRRPARPVGSI